MPRLRTVGLKAGKYAQAIIRQGKPVNLVAAIIIIRVWILLAGFSHPYSNANSSIS